MSQLLLIITIGVSANAQWSEIELDTAFYNGGDVSFPTDQVAYAYVQRGDAILYKSADGGESWNNLARFPLGFFAFKNLEFINADTGFLATSFYTYITKNGGSTWDTFMNKGYMNDMHFAQNRLWYSYTANDTNYLQFSDNLGTTWATVLAAPPIMAPWNGDMNFKFAFADSLNGFVISNANTDTLMVTNDGGRTFNIFIDFTGSLTSITKLHAFSPLHLFIQNVNSATLSTRLGTFPHWPVNFDGWGVLNPLDMTANNINNIYACTYYGKIFKSENEGQSWQPEAVLNDDRLQSIAISPGGKLLVAGQEKLFIKKQNSTTAPKIDGKQGFSIYPNPATNFYYIDNKRNIPIVNIVLMDQMGRKIANYKGTQQKIDVSQLAEGVYLLQIQTNSGLESKKIVVKRN